MPDIQFIHVTKRFGDGIAVNDLYLEIEKGECSPSAGRPVRQDHDATHAGRLRRPERRRALPPGLPTPPLVRTEIAYRHKPALPAFPPLRQSSRGEGKAIRQFLFLKFTNCEGIEIDHDGPISTPSQAVTSFAFPTRQP